MSDHLPSPDDLLQRNAEKSVASEGLSPMDPPDAYDPPGKIDVDPQQMHPFLKGLIAEHEVIKGALTNFEETTLLMKQKGITKEANQNLSHFFHVFDEVFIPHDKKEEKKLFPLLERKLLEKGERSKSLIPITAVDLMEADHVKAIQLAAVTFNFFALASRLREDQSRSMVLDAAIHQSEELIELLRLHIFREDSIVFPLAHQHIDESDLNQMQEMYVTD